MKEGEEKLNKDMSENVIAEASKETRVEVLESERVKEGSGEIVKTRDELSFDVMARYKNKLKVSTKELLDKFRSGEELTQAERNVLFNRRNEWWPKIFGHRYKDWKGEITKGMKRHLKSGEETFSETLSEATEKVQKEVINISEGHNQQDRVWPTKSAGLEMKTVRAKQKFTVIKRERMAQLTRELAAIDLEEMIESFEDENRRVVFYDEDSASFYVVENGAKKEITAGDITADYGWGLKYVPNGDTPHAVFRQLAKRILTNEARRDIEKIYNYELSGSPKGDYTSLDNLLARPVIEFQEATDRRGFIAEAMARELLTRLSYGGELGFIVERANAIEDGTYKYDFKIRILKKKRGVAVEDETQREKSKKIGIQFTIQRHLHGKRSMLVKVKEKYKSVIPVDEIIFLRVITKKFEIAFKQWLDTGRPSGGPEQFLSRDLKTKLLKETTQGLVQITDEEMDKIFPPEPAELSDKKTA